MCTINKSDATKKSGNLFNDPRILNIYDLVIFCFMAY